MIWYVCVWKSRNFCKKKSVQETVSARWLCSTEYEIVNNRLFITRGLPQFVPCVYVKYLKFNSLEKKR